MEQQEIVRLPWFPIEVDRLMLSPMWKAEDYQLGWYFRLLVESTRSERPGYIRKTDDLWRLAGAHSRQFFAMKSSVVMARFKSQRVDGQEWLYNETLLEILKRQSLRYRNKVPDPKTAPSSISFLVVDSRQLDECVERVFKYYTILFKRNIKKYTLTQKRKAKFFARISELLKKNGGDLLEAEKLATQAINNLAANEFCVENGYYDWIDQLFRSEEEFQKRLEPPKKKKGGIKELFDENGNPRDDT